MKTYHEDFPNTISPSAKSQRASILRLLLDRRGWVASPEIASVAQQYNARIVELRRLGLVIENRTEMVNGARHSAFRMVACPREAVPADLPEFELTP
jgi:hypothetical protein